MADFEPDPDIEKTGKITKVLTSNQQVLIQIAKEPISTKGPRVSSEISFAGRYLVLVPFSTGFCFAKDQECLKNETGSND
jgi:ribonuclease G